MSAPTAAVVFVDGPLASAFATLGECELLSVFVHSRAILAPLPALRLVATRSTGYDHIDLAACRKRDIVVRNVPDYGSRTMAEHAIALLFAVARKLTKADARAPRRLRHRPAARRRACGQADGPHRDRSHRVHAARLGVGRSCS